MTEQGGGAIPRERVRLGRDWRQLAVPQRQPASESLCALRRPMSPGAAGSCACGGSGYQLLATGATIGASLCSCVRNCPGCAGRARLLEGNDSRPCRLPPPNVVVNLINAAHIPARYHGATLAGFSNFSRNGREVVQGLSRWLEGFKPSGERGLVMEGPVGVGKTYLLAALAKELAARGHSVRFTDFFQLLGELKAGFAAGKADAAQLQPLIDVDVLFIDEMGKGRNTDFELTVLDQLVCGRYNQNKPIVGSTNYHLSRRGYVVRDDLDRHPGGSGGAFASDQFTSLEQRIGSRIFSRLREMSQFLLLEGDDFRRLEVPGK